VKIDIDVLQAALRGLEVQRQAVDRNIAEVRRMIRDEPGHAKPYTGRRRRARNRRNATAAALLSVHPQANKQPVPPGAERNSQNFSEATSIRHTPQNILNRFENKAGRYELIRVDNGRVLYSFTNQQGKTVDSIMPLIMWQRVAARAGKELLSLPIPSAGL
jgi:hypothetical protein